MFQLHTAQKLCRLFELELQRNFVWMEDVFFTGALHLQTILYSGCKSALGNLKKTVFFVGQSSSSCQAIFRRPSGSHQAVLGKI